MSSSQLNLCSPFLLLDYKNENENAYCTQGCKWSPDGSCFVTSSSNNTMKMFNLPSNVSRGEFNDEKWLMGGWKDDIKPFSVVKESDFIYDYQWYPLMNLEDTKSRCFAVTCRGLPVHLWSYTGECICSYIHYNHLDQLVPAHSLAFSNDGLKLVGGYAKGFQLYDVERPGRISVNIGSQEQPGIISTISFHPKLNNIFAAGSYHSSVGLYSLQTNQAFVILKGQRKGITHLKFSNDGTKLFSGTRNDDDIFCWDMRNPGEVLAVFKRHLNTNQKIYFDITPDSDEYLISGSKEGEILVWDLNPSCLNTKEEILPHSTFEVHKDCVNGVSVHPLLPLLITSSGQRFTVQLDDQNSDDEYEEKKTNLTRENSVKMWWIGRAQ